jgi:hypothetical protein
VSWFCVVQSSSDVRCQLVEFLSLSETASISCFSADIGVVGTRSFENCLGDSSSNEVREVGREVGKERQGGLSKVRGRAECGWMRNTLPPERDYAFDLSASYR